jgi:hypothetical protein
LFAILSYSQPPRWRSKGKHVASGRKHKPDAESAAAPAHPPEKRARKKASNHLAQYQVETAPYGYNKEEDEPEAASADAAAAAAMEEDDMEEDARVGEHRSSVPHERNDALVSLCSFV